MVAGDKGLLAMEAHLNGEEIDRSDLERYNVCKMYRG
jgi:hypothetical protein